MNNNPNKMNNDDLEKHAEQLSWQNSKGNQEKTNKSTAAEGDLLEPGQDPHQIAPGEDGSIPDSEELSLKEEDGYDDPDKLSG